MAEKETSDSELGRSKNASSPADHLLHLLNLGWAPTSPLIVKYVSENHLSKELQEWQSINVVVEAKGRGR